MMIFYLHIPVWEYNSYCSCADICVNSDDHNHYYAISDVWYHSKDVGRWPEYIVYQVKNVFLSYFNVTIE